MSSQEEEKGIGQQAADFVMSFAVIAIAAEIMGNMMDAISNAFGGDSPAQGQDVATAELGELHPTNTPDVSQDRGQGIGL